MTENKKARILKSIWKEDGEEIKDQYAERNQLVAALSKLFPAYLAIHDENDYLWENDWRNIVFIDLPTGQVSWHIHDSELHLFSHLKFKENKWDGHSYEEKYRRLNELPYKPETASLIYSALDLIMYFIKKEKME